MLCFLFKIDVFWPGLVYISDRFLPKIMLLPGGVVKTTQYILRSEFLFMFLKDMRHLTNNSLTVEHLYENEEINVF